MRVHILSGRANEEQSAPTSTVQWLRESAAEDPFRKHTLATSADDADAILFARSHPPSDPYVILTSRHPLVRQRPNQCFLYHDSDYALPVMRGIYPSILKRDYMPDRSRTFTYLARLQTNPYVVHERDAPVVPKNLYSFFGENNSAVRARILAGNHPRGRIFDSTGKRHWSLQPGAERETFMRNYAEAIRDSAFVLCPRGIGPSTYRLFETMEMGRAPVILSDDFVPPPGPEWERFSVTVPEAKANDIADILCEHEGRHAEMGRLARETWEQHFSKTVAFHRMAELCAELMATPLRPFSQIRANAKLLRPSVLRRQLVPLIKSKLKR